MTMMPGKSSVILSKLPYHTFVFVKAKRQLGYIIVLFSHNIVREGEKKS